MLWTVGSDFRGRQVLHEDIRKLFYRVIRTSLFCFYFFLSYCVYILIQMLCSYKNISEICAQFCCGLFCYVYIITSHGIPVISILTSCMITSLAPEQMPQYQWSNPERCGWTGTVAKHSTIRQSVNRVHNSSDHDSLFYAMRIRFSIKSIQFFTVKDNQFPVKWKRLDKYFISYMAATCNMCRGDLSSGNYHYNDVIMTTMASQITSLVVVYSTVYSDADQRKHQCSAPLAFVWENHRDRWIPRTKGQLRGKCFHLMTSSCSIRNAFLS